MASMSDLERQGIYKDEETGEWFLPATRRADGSWRKPRKVKEGYVPQEEIPTYENKGVTWLKSKEGYIPGLGQEEPKKTTLVEYMPAHTQAPTAPMSKAAKKNAKRKQKKKESGDEPKIVTQEMQQLTVKDKSKPSKHNDAPTPSQSQSPKDNHNPESLKKIRNLKKKLKQIDELKEKIDSGELQKPQKEQLEKISKRQMIVDEIEDLEVELDN